MPIKGHFLIWAPAQDFTLCTLDGFPAKPHPVDKRIRSVVSLSCISIPRDTNLARRSLAKYNSPNMANTDTCRTARSLTSFTLLLSAPNRNAAWHCHPSSAPTACVPDAAEPSASDDRSDQCTHHLTSTQDTHVALTQQPGSFPRHELRHTSPTRSFCSKTNLSCRVASQVARSCSVVRKNLNWPDPPSSLHKLEQGLQIVDKDLVNPTTFFPVSRPY